MAEKPSQRDTSFLIEKKIPPNIDPSIQPVEMDGTLEEVEERTPYQASISDGVLEDAENESLDDFFNTAKEEHDASPEGQQENQKFQEKVNTYKQKTDSDKKKYLKDVATKGIPFNPPPEKEKKKLEGIGKTIFKMLRERSGLPTKTHAYVGKTVAVAAERTLESVWNLGLDVGEFFNLVAEKEKSSLPRDFNIVPKEWETPDKRIIGDIGVMFMGWGAIRSVGFFKKLNEAAKLNKVTKGVNFTADAALGGLLDAILLKPEEEKVHGNIANLLNETPILNRFLWDNLTVQEDDTNLDIRIKNFILGGQFTLAADVLFEALSVGVKSLRTVTSKESSLTRKALEMEGIKSSDDVAEKLSSKETDKVIDSIKNKEEGLLDDIKKPDTPKKPEGGKSEGVTPEAPKETKADIEKKILEIPDAGKVNQLQEEITKLHNDKVTHLLRQQVEFGVADDIVNDITTSREAVAQAYDKNLPELTRGRLKKYNDPKLKEASIKNSVKKIQGGIPDINEYLDVPLDKILRKNIDEGLDLDSFPLHSFVEGFHEQLDYILKRGGAHAMRDVTGFMTQYTRVMLNFSRKIGDVMLEKTTVGEVVKEIRDTYGTYFSRSGLTTAKRISLEQTNTKVLGKMRGLLLENVINNFAKFRAFKESIKHAKLNNLNPLTKNRLVVLEDNFNIQLRDLERRINLYTNFDNAINPIRSTAGKTLKNLDPASEKLKGVDFNKLSAILTNPADLIYQQIEELDKAFKGFNIKNLQSDEGTEIIEKSMRENKWDYISAVSDWVGKLVVVNLVSGIKTKLFVPTANLMTLSDALIQDFWKDIYNLPSRGFKYVGQNSEFVQTLSSYLGQLKVAARDVPAFVLGHKKSYQMYGAGIRKKEMIDKIKSKYTKGKIVYDDKKMRQEISDLESDWKGTAFGRNVWEQWGEAHSNLFKNVKTNHRKLDQFMAGFANLFDITGKTLGIGHGIKLLQASDYGTRIIALPSMLRKRIKRNIENQNRINIRLSKSSKERVQVLTQSEIDESVDLQLAVETARLEGGGSSKILKESMDDVDRLTFMNSQVTIAGTTENNIGSGVRGIQSILGDIPLVGATFKAFTNVFLNGTDFIVQRIPLVSWANPDMRKLLSEGNYQEYFAKSMTGMSIGLGGAAYLLLSGDKKIYHADTRQKKTSFRKLTGVSAYEPLVINSEDGTGYVLDELSPMGGLMSYWIKGLHYTDRFIDHKDFGVFMQDLLTLHIDTLSPFELLDKYEFMQDLVNDKVEFGYMSQRTVHNLLDAGIIRETRQYLSNRKEQAAIRSKGQINDEFIRAEETRLQWKKLVERNLPFIEFEGTDKEVPPTDSFGNEIYILNKSVMNPLNIKELNDYSKFKDIAGKVKDGYKYYTKQFSVGTQKFYRDLAFELENDSGLTDDSNKTPLNFYPSPKLTIFPVLEKEAFSELIHQKIPDLYIDLKRKNKLHMLELVYNKDFIVTNEHQLKITKLSGGNKLVYINGKYVTGEEVFDKFIGSLKNPMASEFTVNGKVDLFFLRNGRDTLKHFYKFGTNKEEALKNVFYSKNVDLSKLHSRLGGEVASYRERNNLDSSSEIPEGVRISLIQKVLKDKNLYTPLGRKKVPGIGFSEDVLTTDSLEGRYLTYKVMLPHVSPKVQETYRRAMREILNKVADPYNKFAHYIFMKDVLLNNKKFYANIMNRFKGELQRNQLGFGYTFEEDVPKRKFEHIQR